MSEKDLHAAVVEACQRLGLRVYHTFDARRSEPGFPDLVIVGRRVLFRELKVKGRKLTPAQWAWGMALDDAEADWELWTDQDWDSGHILDELASLR